MLIINSVEVVRQNPDKYDANLAIALIQSFVNVFLKYRTVGARDWFDFLLLQLKSQDECVYSEIVKEVRNIIFKIITYLQSLCSKK